MKNLSLVAVVEGWWWRLWMVFEWLRILAKAGGMFVITFVFAMTVIGRAQSASLSQFPQRIYAVQSPEPSGENSAAYQAVLGQKNMLLSGQTVIVGLGNSASSALFLDT